MNVRIGVTYTSKELQIELPDEVSRDALLEQLGGAVDKGGIVWLTDKKGRTVGVPAEKLAYIEIGPDDDRKVGFGAR